MKDFLTGLFFGVFLMVIALKVFPKTKHYYDGVRDTHKEAFSKGLMTKEIDKNDKVIYRWIEDHKYSNYENE